MTTVPQPTNSTPPGKGLEQNVFGTTTRHVHKVLRHLGHSSDSVISVCTQQPFEPSSFRAETRTVGSLHGWAPPKDMNVWFLPNPLALEPAIRRKGGEVDIARGLTLYADLDVLVPGLKDKGLASLAECELAVKELSAVLGVDPAVVIYSGHGLQPIWRVADAQPITDGAVAWKTISNRWSALVREKVRQINAQAAVDSVFNIDRVLRCPGSINWKYPDEPVPAKCELNLDAGFLTVDGLDAVLPEARTVATAALGKSSVEDGQGLLASFREGPMSDRVAEKVAEVRAAVEAGADRHSTTNSAVMGLVRLGAKGERGVREGLIAVEGIYAGVAEARDDPGEFERSLTPALQKVAGDPDCRPMDYYTGAVFDEEGTLREDSWLYRQMQNVRVRSAANSAGEESVAIGSSWCPADVANASPVTAHPCRRCSAVTMVRAFSTQARCTAFTARANRASRGWCSARRHSSSSVMDRCYTSTLKTTLPGWPIGLLSWVFRVRY